MGDPGVFPRWLFLNTQQIEDGMNLFAEGCMRRFFPFLVRVTRFPLVWTNLNLLSIFFFPLRQHDSYYLPY